MNKVETLFDIPQYCAALHILGSQGQYQGALRRHAVNLLYEGFSMMCADKTINDTLQRYVSMEQAGNKTAAGAGGTTRERRRLTSKEPTRAPFRASPMERHHGTECCRAIDVSAGCTGWFSSAPYPGAGATGVLTR